MSLVFHERYVPESYAESFNGVKFRLMVPR